MVSKVLTVTQFKFRHPFSYYVGRCDHPLVVKIASWFDDVLLHQCGQEFYYTADKYYADAATVSALITRELELDPTYDQREFMALLQRASQLLEEQLDPDGSHRKNGVPR